MTERQIDNVRSKILKIKNALAVDKRKWGGYYDDSKGLRYRPPELYLKINDYPGALKYFIWYDKNFPDDAGYPNFLFEWVIVLFKCGKLKDAEKKAYQTYFQNRYYFDKFFNKPLVKSETSHRVSWEFPEIAETLIYSSSQSELKDFSDWLYKFTHSEEFSYTVKNYERLKAQVDEELVGPKRAELLRRLHLIINNV